MTASPVERRVSRVENDVTSLYDLISDVQIVQGQHSAELTRIHAKLLDHDARFDTIDARFDTIDARFDTIDAALAEILRRLPDAS
jgi:hypothetical protein